MDKEFLSFYNKELGYLRQQGAEFAKKHPKIAGNLRMTKDSIEDPHVSRLIQSVAFLNAKLRQTIDGDYPEFTDTLLSILYPNYLTPIPSMSIVQFTPPLDLNAKTIIQRDRLLETQTIDEVPIRFRTCYETTVWPFKVHNAELISSQNAPLLSSKKHFSSVLHLQLKTQQMAIHFSELAPGKIRLFLKGSPQVAFLLYELLLKNTEVIVASSKNDQNTMELSSEHIKPVGFGVNENVLPVDSRTPQSYQLLKEYFALPEKFLFIDIEGLSQQNLQHVTNELNLYFYVNESYQTLGQYVNADCFALGCTPVINLFKKTAEPINWDHTQPNYPIMIDKHRVNHYEVYSIDSVTRIQSDGSAEEILPVFGSEFDQLTNQQLFWLAHRNEIEDENSEIGSNLDLSLFDLQLNPSELQDWIISTTTLSSNRNLPNKLPFGNGEPFLQFTDGSANVGSIHCLIAPTATRRLPIANESQLYLIALLSNHFVSFTKGEDDISIIRELLRLHDYVVSEETNSIIKSLKSITSSRILAREPSGHVNSFCQGNEINLVIDQTKLSGTSPYLFASLLDRFFAMNCNINAFTKLNVFTQNQQLLYSFTPKTGEQSLI